MTDSDDFDLNELIKKQIIKANSLFQEKDTVENEIKNAFYTISNLMEGSILFYFEKEIDRYSDEVTTLYAVSPEVNSKYIIITYDFDNKSVFPVKITDADGTSWLCDNSIAVKKALSDMISNDEFMIRLISISKEKKSSADNFDDDIPF